MKPIIGLTSSFLPADESQSLPSSYIRAVEQAGGVPFIIPAGICPDLVGDILSHIDALLLTGGPDLDPQLFGEGPHQKLAAVTPERDVIEMPLTQAALKTRMPILAICRGIQVLNVAAGGTLVQDIPAQVHGALKHRQDAPRWFGSHSVDIVSGSRLAELLGTTSVKVNTYHHQSVRDTAPGFVVTAKAPDGIIEAIEKPGVFNVGVQWHPEGMFERVPLFRGLFNGFIKAACE